MISGLGTFNLIYTRLYFILCLIGFIKMYNLIFMSWELWVRCIFTSLWIKKNKSLLDKLSFWSWDYFATWKALFFMEEKLRRTIRSSSQLRQKMLDLLPCFDCFLRTASLLSLSDAVMSFSQFHHNHFVILWHSCASASLEMLRYGTNGIIIGLGDKKHNTAGMTVQTAFLSLLLPSQMQWKGKMWAQTSMVIVYVNSFLSLSF